MNFNVVNDIAVIVVWYEPKPVCIKGVALYSDNFKDVWVIDNSADDHSDLVFRDNVHYIHQGGNLGIANALNVGCAHAAASGYGYVLTMDQDTRMDPLYLHKHMVDARQIFENEKIAIVATNFGRTSDINSLAIYEVSSAITSGSILRISSWGDVGRFDESLFIDGVDHEMCYRLRRNGYAVVVNSSIMMEHAIGDPLYRNILGYKITSTNHDWVRRYYQMRNSLYIAGAYPEYSKSMYLFIRDVRDRIIGILVLEKDIIYKLAGMLLGVIDYFRGCRGAWSDNHGKLF